jgi:hypothetical protein
VNDPHEMTIRVQTLGGQWETLGADRYLGYYPEGLTFNFNVWGPDTCTFSVKRDPGTIHPDLTTWTPIEIEISGRVVWDGRIKETPTTGGDDPNISVSCEGWQYHLDDDVYAPMYVHSTLTDAVDERSTNLVDLNVMRQVFNVQVAEGNTVIGAANADVLTTGTGGAVVFDLGYGAAANRISIDVASSFNTATFALYVMGTDTINWEVASSGREDFISGQVGNAAPFTVAGTPVTITASVANAHRYITVMGYYTATGALGADIYFKITGLRIYASSTYESGGQSVLKANQVVSNALSKTVFLTDTSRVSAGTFSLPEFALGGMHTPREVIEGANAYENYETRVLVGRKVLFAPRSVSPSYEIGEWSGADFQDISAGSGDDIVNRVLVQGSNVDGTALTMERATAGPPSKAATEVTVANPGFEVNTTGWTPTAGTITRDATIFQTGVASGRSTSAAGGGLAGAFVTSTGLVPGRAYTLSIGARKAVANINNFIITLSFDGLFVGSRYDLPSLTYADASLPVGAFTTLTMPFTAPSTSVTAQFLYTSIFNSTDIMYLDNLQFTRSAATLVDRRDFRKTKILSISSMVTTTSASRLGDLYLAAHRTTPYRGSFKAVGQDGVRTVRGGATVHPAFIEPGNLVRCAHRIDPDTGAWGRDGTIVSVAYDHDSLTATVSLDENREGFEALLSRLSVVTSGGNS